MSLKNNQINAINEVLKNDFKSGVIQHATGTGKSVIGINIIKNVSKPIRTGWHNGYFIFMRSNDF